MDSFRQQHFLPLRSVACCASSTLSPRRSLFGADSQQVADINESRGRSPMRRSDEVTQMRRPSPSRVPSPFLTAFDSHRRMEDLVNSPRRRVGSRSPSPLRRSPGREGPSHSSSIADPSTAVDAKILFVARQFHEHFMPGAGQRALQVVAKFAKWMHLADGERDVLSIALSRCQHFMSNVEALLRDAVSRQLQLQRATVNFAFLRWSECSDLCARLKQVLSHRMSGASHTWKSSGDVPVAVLCADGRVASPIRHGRSLRTTPTSKSRRPSLPSYQSIAARWQRASADSVAEVRPFLVTSWRSAADEAHLRKLHELERQLLRSIAAATGDSSSADHQNPIITPEDLATLQCIRDSFTALHGMQDGEATFLMWLGGLPPRSLAAIERTLLNSQQDNRGDRRRSPSPPALTGGL